MAQYLLVHKHTHLPSGGSMKRPTIVAALVTAALLAAGSGGGLAMAAAPSPQDPAGRILGVVPAHGQARALKPGGGSNLSYHNGPVMLSNQVYLVFWEPSGYSVSNNYNTLIPQFFGDVAADSNKSTNVYWSDTQYYNSTKNKIAYSSSLGATYIDTSPLPASGCTDKDTSVCLTDAQIQTELTTVMSKRGWTGGANKLFFMFTAKGIGSCTTTSSGSCAFTQYCAYHSWIGSGSNATMYANMPYADTVPAACDAGQHPNGDDADATINVTSHEHNEAITDPQGSAWYDRRGYENGDKCAWNFGSVSGTAGAEYNQTINNDHYFLQQEWSNASSGCVLQGT